MCNAENAERGLWGLWGLGSKEFLRMVGHDGDQNRFLELPRPTAGS